MSLCMGCHDPETCKTPSYCSPYSGVYDLSIKQATFNDNDTFFDKDFHSCQFLLPKDFEPDLTGRDTRNTLTDKGIK